MWSKQKDSNFLDVRLDLNDQTYEPCRKSSSEPVYSNKQSNHPPNITGNIAKAISKRLTNISYNKNIFNRNIDIYQPALKDSGFDGTVTYNDQIEQASNVNIEEANQARKRKHAILWYNWPYSVNLKMNIGKTFSKLLKKQIPPTHPMYTIFNKNKIKISYICFVNMESVVSSHNKHILNSDSTEYPCNCKNSDKCPLENKCFTPRIVYRADVPNKKLMNTNITIVSLIKRLSDIDQIWPTQICQSTIGN